MYIFMNSIVTSIFRAFDEINMKKHEAVRYFASSSLYSDRHFVRRERFRLICCSPHLHTQFPQFRWLREIELERLHWIESDMVSYTLYWKVASENKTWNIESLVDKMPKTQEYILFNNNKNIHLHGNWLELTIPEHLKSSLPIRWQSKKRFLWHSTFCINGVITFNNMWRGSSVFLIHSHKLRLFELNGEDFAICFRIFMPFRRNDFAIELHR